MLREVEDICARNSMVKSKFFQHGVQLAIDDARKRFGEAANEPTIKVQPLISITSEVDAKAVAAQVLQAVSPVPSIKRGDAWWFDLDKLCDHLGVNPADVLAEIDLDDDVLHYQGKKWVDSTGISEARSLCRDTALSDRFWASAQEKIKSHV